MLSKYLITVLLLFISLPANAGPLHEAAKGGNTAEMQSILAGGADVNESDGIATPLYLAVSGNHVEAVKLLIAKGADVNLPAKFGVPASVAASGAILTFSSFFSMREQIRTRRGSRSLCFTERPKREHSIA